MSSIPLYKSIAQTLIREIMNNDFSKNQPLPTESELCSIFSVSRTTIRQSLKILEEKNYINKIQGSGSYITYSAKSTLANRSTEITSFTDEMYKIGKKPSTKVIKFELIQSSKKIAEDLNLKINENVFYYERILLADSYPYCFEFGYMPFRYFDDFALHNLMVSKFDYVEKSKGYKIKYSQQFVSAILANEKFNKYLKVELDTPLVKIKHTTYTTDQKTIIPLMNSTIIFNSDIYQAEFIKYRN